MITKRLGFEVDVDGTSDRVGDDEEWRRQVVGPGVRVDSALEVAVTGEHAATDQLVLRC